MTDDKARDPPLKRTWILLAALSAAVFLTILIQRQARARVPGNAKMPASHFRIGSPL
jgi:hypothetical protein